MSERDQGTGEGDVIAEGRDTEIVSFGPGRVLRRPKQPRSLEGEAAIMRWVVDRGFPCPRVFEVVPDGLVMERVDGVSMLDDLLPHPWRLRRHAATLAALHDRLHQLDAPDGLPQPFGAGRALVHGDLHPGNVMLTSDGPIVIDWTNAARGPAGADLAVTWLLMAAAEAPGSAAERMAVAAFRRAYVRFFLAQVDRAEAAAALPAVLEHRRHDQNMSPSELEAMARIVERNRP
jgi:aminoglycoside phosphotransferase (APT) family kinase protein